MTSSRAPWPLPTFGTSSKITSGGKWEPRTLAPELSDGLESKWPANKGVGGYRPSDSRNYLINLAQDWAERDGSAKPNVNYYLSELPKGYGLFETDQVGGGQIYKRLFGHPSGRFYDSIKTFAVHFFWLVDLRSGKCLCRLCGNYKPQAPPRPKQNLDVPHQPQVPKTSLRKDGPIPRLRAETSGEESSRSDSVDAIQKERVRRGARQTEITVTVDEEGTKDEYKDVLQRVYKQKGSAREVEDDILERESIDWQAERDILPQYLTQIGSQHSFVPRRGELVLYCWDDFPKNHYLLHDFSTDRYQLYDFKSKNFVGFPRWRAGVVTALPSATSKNGPIDFPDILERPRKKTAINIAGFRVETMPDPNKDETKYLSKQYKYLPLQNIRPLSHWQLLLREIPRGTWHQSITNALTCMTSVSLVEKTKFIGHWKKEGHLFAKACFLGSELITIGDTIRLLPEKSATSCQDILVVDSIRFEMKGFQSEHILATSKRLCNSISVHFVGRGYSTDIKRAYNYPSPEEIARAEAVLVPQPLGLEQVKSEFRPVGTAEYGDWFPLQAPSAKMLVSYDQVLGRLYEADALRLWSGQRQHKFEDEDRHITKPDLGYDLSSVIAARSYATKTDERLPELPKEDPNGIKWILSDHRAQALSVATINGQPTAAYDEVRTPATLDEWRLHMMIATDQEVIRQQPVVKKKPKYRWTEQDFEGLDGFQDPSQDNKKRRGRKPGSKLIDGKVYTAAELSNMREAPTGADGVAHAKDLMETIDLEDEDQSDIAEEDEQDELAYQHSPSTIKRSSQMAGAALNASTDEDDIEDEDDYADDLETHRPLEHRLAAYGSGDDEDDAAPKDDSSTHRRIIEESSEDENMTDDLQLSDFQKPPLPSTKKAYIARKTTGSNPHTPGLQNLARKSTGKKPQIPRPSSMNIPPPIQEHPPSKTQIMESAQQNDDSDDSNDNNDDDSDLEEDIQELYLEDWKDPRRARGGTEESEGGDYRPGESQ